MIEPSDVHYYQPLWTLVGGGAAQREETVRPQASVIPDGVQWIKARAERLDPDQDQVVLEGGEAIGYDVLIVAAGIELHWAGIKGLEGAVGRDGICSNYSYDTVESTWRTIQAFEGGTALFTMPPPPIKCAGAPQKIAYLADDAFRRQGVRDRSKVIYAAGTPGLFAVPEYAKTLSGVVARKGIETRFQHVLVEVRPQDRQAIFEDRAQGGEAVVIDYDMLHVTPPQRAPRLVRESPLAVRAAGSPSTATPSRAPRTRTSSRSATPRACRRPRRARRCAGRRRSSPRTCSRSSMAPLTARSRGTTTATPPARSSRATAGS